MAKHEYRFRDVFYPRVAVAPDQASANAQLAPDTLVVIATSELAKSIKMHCPCGCGAVLTINLVPQSGRAWRMLFEKGKGISLYPSVWLDVGCQSHFVLRRNVARVLLGRMPPLDQEEIDSWWTD